MSKLRTAELGDVYDVDTAIGHLQRARDLLARAHCPQAADAVRRALKSADGARRHAKRAMLHSPEN